MNTRNKTLALSLVGALGALAGTAHAETFFDQARVRSAEPVYESVTVPRQQCSTQVVNQVQQVGGGRDYSGAVIGGVAGAVLGNQIGGGSGRDAATVLGAVGGAAVGSQVGRNMNTQQPMYRVTVQTDQGTTRFYDVAATGDLRVGDRVRVENGVLYRS